MQYEARFGRYGRKSVDCRLCFVQVGVARTLQQRFDQRGGRYPAPDHVASIDECVDDVPGQFNCSVCVARSVLLLRDQGVLEPHRRHGAGPTTVKGGHAEFLEARDLVGE